MMAIRKLKVLGNGFSVIPMGGRYLVQSVPGELTMDHTTILQNAEVSERPGEKARCMVDVSRACPCPSLLATCVVSQGKNLIQIAVRR